MTMRPPPWRDDVLSSLVLSLPQSDGAPGGNVDPLSVAVNEEDFVQTYLLTQKIIVGADGLPRRESEVGDSVSTILRRLPVDAKVLIEEIEHEAYRRRRPFRRAHIARSLNIALRRQGQDRYAEHMLRLYAPLTADENARAAEQFVRFATLFACPPEIAIVAIRQFIFAAKSKQLGRKVAFPQMLVLMNTVQGSGKSELVLRLLKPLRELASDPVPFDELVDPRSVALFQNVVVNIDDAGPIARSKVALLKSAISSETFQRRILGVSAQRKFHNKTTFIASTNENILKLVPDPTGYRRFMILPFRNGAVEKAGDPDVWKTMDDLDFELMWRAVSVDDAEPVRVARALVHEHQKTYIPMDPFEEWLRAFNFNSEAALNNTGRHGIAATDMYELYRNETGDDSSDTRLGRIANRCAENDLLPFGKTRFGKGEFFYAKTSSAVDPSVTAASSMPEP